MPGVSTPNFPFGGAIFAGLRIPFPPGSLVAFRTRTAGDLMRPSCLAMSRVQRRDGAEQSEAKHNMMRHPDFFCKSIPNPPADHFPDRLSWGQREKAESRGIHRPHLIRLNSYAL
jgi:hypothetical protein